MQGLTATTRCRRAAFGLVFTGFLLLGVAPASAAQLAGVTMPPTEQADGASLKLNGIGLRTYSILGVHIYVAALYLQSPSHSGAEVLASPGVKVIRLQFLRSVGADAIRKAWRSGLQNNCTAPCTLSPALLTHFLSFVTPVHKGDLVKFVFGPKGLTSYYNGHPAGRITDTSFAQLMLASFIGPHVNTPELKRALLGQ